MAASTRSPQALLLMKHGQKPYACSNRAFSTSPSTLSDAHPYSPSSFNRPLRSPLGTPPLPVDTDYLPPPPRREQLSPSERPIRLPEFIRDRRENAPKLPPGAKFTFTNWMRNTMGLEVKADAIKPLSAQVRNNPYRTRKVWPPDFKKLNYKQQLHFEKAFRRRAILKWARPNFHKWVIRLQRSLYLLTIIYFVFIADMEGGTPFDGFRIWFFGHLKNLNLRPDAAKAAEEYEMEARADRERWKEAQEQKKAKKNGTEPASALIQSPSS